MTVTLVILLLGSLLIYAGWTNRSVLALIRGDNTVTKAAP